MMPVNKWLWISAIILFYNISPVWSNSSNPVNFCKCRTSKGGIRLSTNLPLKSRDSSLPMLTVLHFNDENSMKSERRCR
ncbi:hypothetical protein IW261DRAFT_1516063 [Armillaria novae-zelandiae]|uniref:Secreted protein n=1 Tax=Armillaria novae-zelandiae TaxID=153914 RepID=A0AA39NRP9_9AGAR|nr:hypothetical protein IW261DRAFT_1516063 [Armillaria novae-zelandiae]